MNPPFPHLIMPTFSNAATIHAWQVAPNGTALETLAKGIWQCAVQTGQRPLVVLSTAGPVIGLRAGLERYRPQDLSASVQPGIAFLPQVMSSNDWLEAAPKIWSLPPAQNALTRWLAVYATLKKHPQLQAWFTADSEAGTWGLAQAIIEACDTLSAAALPELQKALDLSTQNSATWLATLEPILEKALAAAYPVLARQVVDKEAQVLLNFWRYLSGVGDPIFRRHFAMAAHLQAAKELRSAGQGVYARPLIWVQTADAKPIEQDIVQAFLNDYAQHAVVVQIEMAWQTVALWPEALAAISAERLEQNHEAQTAEHIAHNLAHAPMKNWRLISARSFEELAWAAARSIEEQVMAGKTKIALVAQDRLAARRARALLARLGPALNILDETGWKLSTTRAAAALNSWLVLLRAPEQGPSALDLLEFLKNPFLNLPHCLGQSPENCAGLVAELEDLFIARQAQAGWETFYLAIEGVSAYSSTTAPNPLLLQLVQCIRGRLNTWQKLKLSCATAYEALIADLEIFGMAQGLEQDSAGQQLLNVIHGFDLGSSDYKNQKMRLGEWLSLLKTVIEEAAYEESGREAAASLSILPLSSTRLRQFDAVVVIGCDEQQLPAYADPPLFFSEALNYFLKSSTITAQYIQQAKDLSQLLMSCPQVDLLWQSKTNQAEPLGPSPWIQRLQLDFPLWQVKPARVNLRAGKAQPLQMASARLSPDLPMPLSMSPSAYRALRDCPYRYYVRSLLNLRKLRDFEEGFDASLAGQTVHKVLRQFYDALKSAEIQTHLDLVKNLVVRRQWMLQNLSQISEQVFKRLIDGDARVLGVLRDWQKQIPSFVDWQLAREANGWQFMNAETPVGFDLMFQDSNGIERAMRIEGRADRFDTNIHNQSAEVIDYKHQRLDKIISRAESILEDPQLLIYARGANEGRLFPAHQVNLAAWVALRPTIKAGQEEVERALTLEQMPELMSEFNEQLTEDLTQLWSGATLTAFAPDGVCLYCEARGICRKGVW
ncbi:PD-(D/E)XK nuclease family protein [Polynucleobacter sp. IMCC 29146]|nr:PD-(D/E)XK nuclease family protein [Polynucleobacter sp. IMCC 29146]